MTNTTDQAVVSQRVRALQLANRVRCARAELKARIAAGRVSVADVLFECPREAAGMPVVQLLGSQHGWGVARSRALLARVPVREDKPIGSLTERQRLRLEALLAAADGANGQPSRRCTP